MNEMLAVASGVLTVTMVLVLGALARQGPPARRPSADGTASDDLERRPAPPDPAARPPPARRVRLAAITAVGGVAGFALAGPIGTIGAAGAAVAFRRRRRVRTIAAARRRVEAAMPDAIELLVVCVHAGRSPTQAVTELAMRGPPDVRHGFVAVVRRLHRGDGLADALAQLPLVLGPTARELAAVVATADREGLPMGPMLDRLAADARAARRRQGEAAARRLPVQLAFPLVVCVLPSFVLVALAPAVLGALSTLRATAP